MRLLEIHIPSVVKEMDRQMVDKKYKQFYENSLNEVMHRHGINLRYMGRLRQHSKNDELKELLLTEIVARVVSGR